MSSQYTVLYEETTRGIAPVTPAYMFLPTMGDLTPDFDATDKGRIEYRGQDSAMGPTIVLRTEIKWSYKLKCYWYPGKETDLLFKHLLGNPGTPVMVDGTAYQKLITPIAMPYGTGPLLNKAIAIVANTDENGVTKSQIFGGGRITSCKITCKGTDDIELEFSLEGAWVGPCLQAAIGGISFPPAAPYNSSQYTAYIGGAPVRTGTAPNYTALTSGTAVQFMPDSLDITITNGLKDKTVGNGVRGPSKSTRSASFKVEIACPIDYEDPASGFQSAAEFQKLFAGPALNNLFIVFDNATLAGAATQDYQAVIDLPSVMQKNPKKADRDPEGKTPGLKLAYESLNSTVTGYPIAMFLTDQAAIF